MPSLPSAQLEREAKTLASLNHPDIAWGTTHPASPLRDCALPSRPMGCWTSKASRGGRLSSCEGRRIAR